VCGWQLRRLGLILAVGSVLIAACGGSGDASPPVSPSPASTTPTSSALVTSPTQADTDVVLDQYAAFFDELPRASRMRDAPAADRPPRDDDGTRSVSLPGESSSTQSS
jgi:hypothetical protein